MIENTIGEIKIFVGAAEVAITTTKEEVGVEIINNITALLLTMMIAVIIKIVEITDDVIMEEEDVIMTITIDVIGNDVEALGRRLDLQNGLHLDKTIHFGTIDGRQWNCKRKLMQWRNAVGTYWTTLVPEIPKILVRKNENQDHLVLKLRS